MSHFTTWVLVSASITEVDEVEERVRELLKPYDENLKVPPYQETCYCVTSAARARATEAAEQETGTTLARLREVYNSNPSVALLQREYQDYMFRTPWKTLTREQKKPLWEQNRIRDKKLQALWEVYTRRFLEIEKNFMERDPQKGLADAACEECKGTGTVTSTSNPNAKWDWWVIGGRWAGDINELELPDDWDLPYGSPEYERVRALREDVSTNSRLLSTLPESLDCFSLPFAILSPDGWDEKGQMGWFGVYDKSQEESWGERARAILNKFRDGYQAVACDLHI